MSWEDYDYEYNSEAYMLDREFTKCGRHPLIVERPIPRVENMTEFYNHTQPSHFINGALVKKRRVYSPYELRPARRVGGTMGMNQGPATLPEVDLVPSEGIDLIQDPPAKLLKEDHTPNHHLGHLLGVLVLDHVPDQDLLPTPEVGLDLHPTAHPPQGMKHIFHHGKGKLHKSWGIRKAF